MYIVNFLVASARILVSDNKTDPLLILTRSGTEKQMKDEG